MLASIKQYLIIILAVIFILLLGTSIVLININKNQKQEIERLSSNQDVLNDSVTFYRSKSGKLVANVDELVYSVKELKKYNKENADLIKDLGLKFKQVQNVINTGIVTVVRDTVPLRDSILITKDTLKYFNKRDNYINLTGYVLKQKDSVAIDFQSVDTISSVAHWNYKKWFIFKCRDKNSISLEITNKNPYTKITYSKFIKIKQ